MTRRVGVLDCGTNSLRLLVAESDGHGGVRELDRRLELVRLGQGVDATGEFHPDALRRTFAATDAFAEVLAGFGVGPADVCFVATSATRDAGNREEFFAGIEARLGVRPDVISGDAEARLSFAGAVSGAPGLDDPVLVIDIGGGSTELILGAGDRIERAVSLDVGSVRLRERLLVSDPPTAAEIRATEAVVDDHLDGAFDLSGVRGWIGVAGTATSLAAIYLELPAYDRARVHGCRIPVPELAELAGRILATDVAGLRRLPSLHPQRADVISAGALILRRVARRVGADTLTVSESDILDGLARQLLG